VNNSCDHSKLINNLIGYELPLAPFLQETKKVYFNICVTILFIIFETDIYFIQENLNSRV